MMKKTTAILLMMIMLAALLMACASEKEEQLQASARTYADFEGEDIAVITGVLTYNTTEKIGGNPIEYSESGMAAEDVRQGRVAGFMHALTLIQIMAEQLGSDTFEVVAIPKEIFSAQIGGISADEGLIGHFNEFLSEIEEDGTLADMKERWFGDARDLNTPMPEINNPGNHGVLKVAVCSDAAPFVFLDKDGNFSGFSVELALRFGARGGTLVALIDTEFAGLIPAVVNQEADFGIANMAITEERKQVVLFTEPFFDEQHGILTLK